MSHTDAYQQTLKFLYEDLPVFSKLGKTALKHDLHNIKKLCEALGNPEQKIRTIHIAGTNGKGSTSHALAAILQHAGYKTGLYTSPHLIDFRERIRVNGVPISQQWVVNFVQQHKTLIDTIAPSFFEVTVAMALVAFATQQVDFAVIETGLGGRLDSTNIITPELSIITNISFDHQDVLGNTLKEIAGEKAGIIKSGVPVLIGEQNPDTDRVFLEKAIHAHSTLYEATSFWDLVTTTSAHARPQYRVVHKARREIYDLHTDLTGSYQQHNIKTVLAAVEILMIHSGLSITIPQALEALTSVKKTTGLRGRWDEVLHHPLIMADVAHNPAGIQETMRQWGHINANKKYILTGFAKDKDVQAVTSYFPKEELIYTCQAQIPRAMPVAELSEIFKEKGYQVYTGSSVEETLEKIITQLEPDDALLITGSFFVVGEALAYVDEKLKPQAYMRYTG